MIPSSMTLPLLKIKIFHASKFGEPVIVASIITTTSTINESVMSQLV